MEAAATEALMLCAADILVCRGSQRAGVFLIEFIYKCEDGEGLEHISESLHKIYVHPCD